MHFGLNSDSIHLTIMYYVTLSTTNDVTLNHGKKVGGSWAKILPLR